MMDSFTHPLPELEVYLLRVWYEIDGDDRVWRGSLLLPQGAQRRYFATPEALLAFLDLRIRDPSPQ
jgi:hypothetical protein